ncbi:MAG: HNH endonuclease [Candidatus Hydrogenedens sp.]|nr:HNH endonuclease [Candidatus Hydrogenedens sp.]
MVDAQVLVLNKSWIAVNVTSLRRAMLLLFHDSARVVHPHDYSLYDFDSWCALSNAEDGFSEGRYIYTPNMRVRLPEVIVLNAYNRFVKREVRLSRKNIFERDRHVCQYCKRKFSKADLTIDHVMPRSRGGRDTWENLVLACVKCNIRKGSRTPDEAHMPLLRRPAKPKWLPKFGTHVPKESLHSWQRFVDMAYWNTEIGD